jgi:hypothetical protein
MKSFCMGVVSAKTAGIANLSSLEIAPRDLCDEIAIAS